jgi:RHS repeat-associated protein
LICSKTDPNCGPRPVVTPQGLSVTVDPGSRSYNFTVRNSGTESGTVYFDAYCSGAGAVTSCATSPTSATMAAGATRTQTVTYQGASSGGSGIVNLEAQLANGSNLSRGYINVTVNAPPSYTVSVTPDGGSISVGPGSKSYTFRVTNTGNQGSVTYNLAASCSVGISACSPSTGSVTLSAGQFADVPVSYQAAEASSGTLGLTAAYSGNGAIADGGSINVSVGYSFNIAVTPDNETAPADAAAPASYSFTIRAGNTGGTYYLNAYCGGGAGGCGVSPSDITLAAGQTGWRTVTYTNSVAGVPGTVTLKATYSMNTSIVDSGWVNTAVRTYYASVSPKDTTAWHESGTTTTQTFRVGNGGNSGTLFSLSVVCSAGAINCSQPANQSIAANGTINVPVTYTAGTPGASGVVKLIASAGTGGSATRDSGWVNVRVISHAVAVTPIAPSNPSNPLPPGSYTQSFTVRNDGNVNNSYNLAVSCSGGVAGCPASLPAVNLNGGISTTVGVSYSIAQGAPAGTIQLTASYAGDGAINHTGAQTIYARHVVTPDGGTISSDADAPSNYPFTVRAGSVGETFYLQPICSPNIGNCQAVPTQITLTASQTAFPSVTYTNVSSGTGTVGLRAISSTNTLVVDSGWVTTGIRTYTVSVGEDGTTAMVESGATNTQSFTVYNNGNTGHSYRLTAACRNGVTGCTQPTPTVIPPQSSATYTVGYQGGAPGGSGRVVLIAEGGSAGSATIDSAWVNVTVISHAVEVTEKNLLVTKYPGTHTQLFTVRNKGNVANSYTFRLPCADAISQCTASPASTSNLAVNGTQAVTVTYRATATPGAATSPGVARLVAENTIVPAVKDSAWANVTVKAAYTITVTPKSGVIRVDSAGMASVPFELRNTGTASSMFSLFGFCSGSGAIPPCTADPATVPVPPTGSPVSAVVRATQTGSPGTTALVGLAATANADGVFTDTGKVTIAINKYAVAVTPDAQAVAPSPYATETRPFTVTNAGNITRTFDIAVMCAPPAATGCSASVSSVTLDSAAAATVNVTYKAGDPGATGTLRLVATDRENRSVNDGTMNLTVGTTVTQNVVRVNELNPGTSIERSQCLVFAIVRDVVSECGMLRITYPLPSVRTLGKTRTPTLIYYSDHIKGPTLPVDVILANATAIPDSVVLVVQRIWPDSSRDTVVKAYTGSQWSTNRRRRVAAPSPANARGTGIMRYTVEVSLRYPTQTVLATPAVTGALAVVDRTNTPFGAGWWLAGLEQLFFQGDSSVLWVAGDGSTRRYVNQRTLSGPSGTDTVYMAAALDRPDTLLRRSDGMYQRQAGNGLFTEFDGLGLHRRTVTRLGYSTVFDYDGSSRLKSIQIPPRRLVAGVETPAHNYAFAYNPTTQRLGTVTAPSIGGQDRVITLVPAGTPTAVRRIIAQLGATLDTVYYGGFAGAEMKYTFLENRVRIRTHFTYETGAPTLRLSRTPTGTPAPAGAPGDTLVAHSFWPASSLGANTLVATNVDSAYFRYDGPRPAAVGDTTWFWVNGLGAPVRIRNALNKSTHIVRGDARFPTLATEMRAANGFTTWASYDGRGNVRMTTEVNPRDDGKDATTFYEWHPKWDGVTNVIQPEGEVTITAYEESTGHRLWQEDGRGIMSRVNFRYYATTDVPTGAVERLLRAVELPQAHGLDVGIESVRYDSVGNVDTTRTARGAWTGFTSDAVGRTTKTSTRIYADSAHTVDVFSAYDALDRLTQTRTVGPGTNCAPDSLCPEQVITVDNFYDREGRLDSLVRSQSPDYARSAYNVDYPALGRVVSRWKYDNLGRVVAEIAPDGTAAMADNPIDSMFYDLGGNVERVRTRRRDGVSGNDLSITMTYDVLNRLKTRTVPAVQYRARVDGIADANEQPTQYQYNAPYPRWPNNSYTAQPRESAGYPGWGGYTVPGETATFDYDNVGNLTRADNVDAQVRRRYYPNGQLRYDTLRVQTLARDDTLRHDYALEYAYDRNGRPVTIKHPPALSNYSTRFEYDRGMGALRKVIDPLANEFTYEFDARRQVATIMMPRNVYENYRYDQDGSLIHHMVTTVGGVTYHDATLTHDLRGKQTSLINSAGAKDTVISRYSGLGHIRLNLHSKWLRDDPEQKHTLATERFAFNALGDRTHSEILNETFQGSNPVRIGHDSSGADWYYQRGTGRLFFNIWGIARRDTTQYDEAGNTVFFSQSMGVNPSSEEDRATYYSADGRARAVDYRQVNGAHYTTFDEYRYDALGRRVWVRSRRGCAVNGDDYQPCLQSYVRRTVWAGDQELYEIQMPDNDASRENDVGSVPTMPRGSGGDYDPNTFYGQVAYTHGLGIDRPLSITRMRHANYNGNVWNPFTIVPLWNVRGYADTSYFAETGATNCLLGLLCVGIQYITDYWTPAWPTFGKGITLQTFHGTLLVDKSDHTGQLYRRNRYYDPKSGRFTQEDPIGLAGGVNLYGFANGDPVNYSDPFGLTVCFRGNHIRRAVDAVERATGSRITLDDNNCISKIEAISKDPRHAALRGRLQTMAEDTKTHFGVEIYDAVPPFKATKVFVGTDLTVHIGSDAQDAFANRYATPLWGLCIPKTGPPSNAAFVAHELLGHLYGQYLIWKRTGMPAPTGERYARAWENLYHRAVGEPIRCGD